MSDFKINSATDISSVIKAHFAWKLKIKAIVEGNSNELYDLKTIASHNKCVLGKWIEKVKFDEIGQDERFFMLKEKHGRFHELTAEIIQSARLGNMLQVSKEISTGEYAQLSRKVVTLLTELYKDYK